MYNSEISQIAQTYQVNLKGKGNTKRLSVGSELLETLLPFKPVMKKQLLRKGYNVKFLPFKTIVALYYNEFISAEGNPNSQYQPINLFDFENNPLFRFSVNDNLNGEITSFRNRTYIDQISETVHNIIETFKTARAKKNYLVLAGTNNFELAMNHVEVEQANATEKIEKDLQNKLTDNKPVTIKSFTNIIIIGIIIALLIYMSE
jgi:hypothetical protein